MNRASHILFMTSIVCAIASGCAPPTAQPTATATPAPPSPTSPPTPLANLSGALFFDLNGDGLPGQGEEPVAGINVCAEGHGVEKVCTASDDRGRFQFPSIAPAGSVLKLGLNDPNQADSTKAFRYASVWKQEVTVPAQGFNGYEIPEQRLADAGVLNLPISGSIEGTVGRINEIGLMQGFLTMPFPQGTEIAVWTWYDLDSTKGQVANWKGEASAARYDNTIKIFDNHYGTDWLVPEGTWFLAPAPSVVEEIFRDPDPESLQGDSMITLYHPGTGLYTHYGHLIFDSFGVKVGDRLVRGQYIATTIRAPSGPGSYPYPNMLHGQIQCCRSIAYPLVQSQVFDYFRAGSNPGYWTKENDPQFTTAW